MQKPPTPQRQIQFNHPIACKLYICPHLFVLPEQSSKRIEFVAVLVDIRHAASQARLQLLRMVAEDQHDHSPREGSERWPGVMVDRAVERFGRYNGETGARLDSDACEGEHDARKDVDDDLLVDRRYLSCTLRSTAKDEVTADETAYKRVVCTCIESVSHVHPGEQFPVAMTYPPFQALRQST